MVERISSNPVPFYSVIWWFGIFCAFAVSLFLGLMQPKMAAAAGISDYELAAGDTVEFDFLDDQELPRQLTVGSGGNVQVPLLGAVKISGATLDEAKALINKQFVDRKLLVDPKIALSIATYRAVFVLGDVKNPGSFPFQLRLTVEQAVGLAGGPLTVQSSAEDRIFGRARLQGELDSMDSEIAHEAAWAARLLALLDNRSSIAIGDLPIEAEPFLKKPLVDKFVAVENRILDAELTAYASQKSILSSNIAETSKQLELLGKLAQNQQDAIKFTQEELDRANKLLKTGLKTAAEMADIQRQFTLDEGRLLQILSDTAGTQRQIAALKLQLAALEDGRKKDTLVNLQDRKATLGQLFAKHRATEEQLYLITNWASVEAESNRQTVIQYKIRARNGDQTGDQIATGTTELLPGDVLIISIERPEPAKTTAVKGGSNSTN